MLVVMVMVQVIQVQILRRFVLEVELPLPRRQGVVVPVGH